MPLPFQSGKDNQQKPQTHTIMAIAAFILGIIALLFSFIPLVGALAIFPGVLGLILGVIALILKWKKGPRAMAIVSVILCGLSVLVANANMAVTQEAAKEFGKEIDRIDREFKSEMDKADREFKSEMNKLQRELESDLD